jgi:RimJ/RimL family protein N-acetyltransferase
MAIFAAVETPNGVAGLRDLAPADIPAIVDYWLLSPDEHLAYMAVDRQRLGSADEIRKRFSVSIRTGDPAQPTISLAVTLDEKLVGYTLFVRHSEDVNYAHWHIIVPDMRAKGITTALYPSRIKTYFDIAPISRLIHQTRTRNLGVNRMLDKFYPVAETEIIDKPDGVALPGEFHLRYVRREDIPGIFVRAEELRASATAQRSHAAVEPGS